MPFVDRGCCGAPALVIGGALANRHCTVLDGVLDV
jgi:hypothetical protein